MKTMILFLWTTSFALGQGSPIEINYSSELKDYEVLKGQLEQFKIFFDGEGHNVSSNDARHFDLFKWLYFNYGVRYLIKEYDFQWAYYVNKYIQTGKLDWIKSGIPSREAGEFYSQLYEFNKSLPNNEKILLLSIDAYGFQQTQDFIDKLASDKGEQPDRVRMAVDVLKTIKRTHSAGMGMDIKGKDKNEILAKLKTVQQLVNEDQKPFIEYFGADYIFFHLLVFNKASENRIDSNLASNFIEFSKTHNKGNYYFYYGNWHCQLKPTWIAGILNESSEFKNQVCSFTSQYTNSETLLFNKNKKSGTWTYETKKIENFGILDSGPYDKKIIEKLQHEQTGDCALYSANQVGQGIEKVTTFLFFLKNQKAVESYLNKD